MDYEELLAGYFMGKAIKYIIILTVMFYAFTIGFVVSLIAGMCKGLCNYLACIQEKSKKPLQYDDAHRAFVMVVKDEKFLEGSRFPKLAKAANVGNFIGKGFMAVVIALCLMAYIAVRDTVSKFKGKIFESAKV